jgi:hypothetical protein
VIYVIEDCTKSYVFVSLAEVTRNPCSIIADCFYLCISTLTLASSETGPSESF